MQCITVSEKALFKLMHESIAPLEITGSKTHLKSHYVCKYNCRKALVILLFTEKCLSIYVANEYLIWRTLLSSTE